MKTNEDLQQLVDTQDNTWDGIHARTNRWISDFEFFQDEIRFIQRLLAKAEIWITAGEDDLLVDKLTKKLYNLELRRDLFVRVIKYHRTQIEAAILDPFTCDGAVVGEDHRDLEKRIGEFMIDFRENKSTIYQIVEAAVDAQRLPYLLESVDEYDMIGI